MSKKVFIVAAGALMMAMAAHPAQGQVGGTEDPPYERGRKELSRRDYDGAISSFTEAAAFNPNDSNAYLMRGQCFYYLRQFQKAIEDFDRAQARNNTNAEIYLWKGTALAKAGEPEKAKRAYLMAFKNDPKLVEQYKKGGGGANVTVTAKNEGAVMAYEKAVDLYLKGENSDEQMVDDNSDHPVCESSSTETMTVRKIEDIDRAINMDPSNAGLYFERGLAYKRKGNLNRAIADISEAISFNPMIARYYLARARCYHERHDEALSRSDIKKAQSVDPKVPHGFKFVDEN